MLRKSHDAQLPVTLYSLTSFSFCVLLLLWAQMVKNLPAMWETRVQFLVRKIPGEWNGNPLQYSCLENPMDRGAWQAIVRGVTELDTTERLTLSLAKFSFYVLLLMVSLS